MSYPTMPEAVWKTIRYAERNEKGGLTVDPVYYYLGVTDGQYVLLDVGEVPDPVPDPPPPGFTITAQHWDCVRGGTLNPENNMIYVDETAFKLAAVREAGVKYLESIEQ